MAFDARCTDSSGDSESGESAALPSLDEAASAVSAGGCARSIGLGGSGGTTGKYNGPR